MDNILYTNQWGSFQNSNTRKKTYLKDFIQDQTTQTQTQTQSQKTATDEPTTETTKLETETTKLETKENLLPIMNPIFNLREIVKQIVLLEEHLNIGASKACFDCIQKHFLAIEAYAEEMLALSNTNKLESQNLPAEIRQLQRDWYQENKSNLEIQQELRQIRKRYMNQSFGVIFDNNKSKTNTKDCKNCSV